jgi:hypothetical protein
MTKPEQGNSTYEVTVYAPRHPDPKAFSFPHGMTVGEAAAIVAAEFGYTGGSQTFKNAAGEVLDRNKPLAGEHVRDGAVLELIDVGGGV